MPPPCYALPLTSGIRDEGVVVVRRPNATSHAACLHLEPLPLCSVTRQCFVVVPHPNATSPDVCLQLHGSCSFRSVGLWKAPDEALTTSAGLLHIPRIFFILARIKPTHLTSDNALKLLLLF